jgi:hypothetical protein
MAVCPGEKKEGDEDRMPAWLFQEKNEQQGEKKVAEKLRAEAQAV